MKVYVGGVGFRATRLLMQDFRKQVSGAWGDRVQVFRIAPTSVQERTNRHLELVRTSFRVQG